MVLTDRANAASTTAYGIKYYYWLGKTFSYLAFWWQQCHKLLQLLSVTKLRGAIYLDTMTRVQVQVLDYR